MVNSAGYPLETLVHVLGDPYHYAILLIAVLRHKSINRKDWHRTSVDTLGFINLRRGPSGDYKRWSGLDPYNLLATFLSG